MKKYPIILTLLLTLSPISALAYTYYGAIAVNPNTGKAYPVIDYSNSVDAENSALSECGKNCVIAVSFYDSCGAVAYSPKKKKYFDGWYDDSQALAELEATISCEKSNAKDCEIVASACTSWEIEYD